MLTLGFLLGALSVAFAPSSAPRDVRFANPPSDCRLLLIRHEPPENPATNVAEVARLAARGFGGYAGNVAFGKVGSSPWYVDNEKAWVSFKAAADHARSAGLTLWMYDEYAYPSLSAGDRVLKGHPELEQTGWLVAMAAAKGGEKIRLDVPPGRFLRAVAAKTDAEGRLADGGFVDVSGFVRDELPLPEQFARARSKPLDAAGRPPLGLAKTRGEIRTGPFEWTAPADGDWTVYVITEDYIYEGTHPECKGWEAKFRYPNPLVKTSAERFLALTHAAYARHLGDDLGRYFVSTFTDEPSLMGNWWRPMPYFVFSSSPELAVRYRTRTGGRDLVADIPHLVTDSADGLSGRLRIAFWDESARLYEESYFRPISDWCRARGFRSGGHLMGEESFAFHVSNYGNFFRCLKALDVPSVDCLTSIPANVPYLTALFAGSARELKGAPLAMAEVSSLAEDTRPTRYDVSDDEIRGTLNRLLWGGVSAFTSYYGWGRRPDGWTRAINLELGRTVTLVRDGRSAADVALFYPAKDAMRVYRPQTNVWKDAGTPVRKLQDAFDAAARSLYEDGRCFLIVDEETVENATVEGDALAFRDLRFRALVLPSVSTLSRKAKDVLLRFKASGGLLVRADAATDVAAALRGRLERHVTVEAAGAAPIRVAHRRAAEGDVFLVMNDSAAPFAGQLRFCGDPKELELWDVAKGTHAPAERTADGRVSVALPPYRACVFTTPTACVPQRISCVSRPVGRVEHGRPVVVDFGPQGEGGYPAADIRAVSAPGVKLRLSYSTHPDGLGERGDFWHETRATYLGPDVWLPIAPANTDRFDVFAVTNAGVVRAAKAQGLVRYVRIAVDTPGASADVASVVLENRGVHSEEPVVGSFACSDDELTRIWRASVRTCRLASIPARGSATLPYVSDGAKRDRLVWSGDLWWAQRNMYVAFGPDSPYMAGSIDMLAENQTPAGYVNACPYPESRGPVTTEAYGPFGSDEFAAWFVPVLADHYLHTGDRALLARRYPNVVRLMDYLAAHQGPDGLFEQRRETAKHSEGLKVGGTSLHHRAYMHLLLWRAYSDAAGLAEECGKAEDRARFAAAAGRLAGVLRTRFYDGRKGRFILSLEQPEEPAFVANAAAVAFGFSKGEEAARILAQLERDGHGKFQMMAIRGAFAVRDGKKALALLDAHNWRAVVRDDWPGTHLVSECMALVHEGWSDEAHPDTALAGVLTDYVLGVRPLTPGYGTFAVDPIVVPGVTWAKGRVPTPAGPIEVEWKLVDGRPDIRVTAPPDLTWRKAR